MDRKDKKVLAFGTFDLLHPGHLSYLEQARKLGTRLTVIVARDRNVAKAKGRPPVNDERARLALVRALKCVDDAFLGDEKDIYQSVVKHAPDVLALGYDQAPPARVLQRELNKRGIAAEIRRMKPYKKHEHKSSHIKQRVKENH